MNKTALKTTRHMITFSSVNESDNCDYSVENTLQPASFILPIWLNKSVASTKRIMVPNIVDGASLAL
jgi:hypothetical protein